MTEEEKFNRIAELWREICTLSGVDGDKMNDTSVPQDALDWVNKEIATFIGESTVNALKKAEELMLSDEFKQRCEEALKAQVSNEN